MKIIGKNMLVSLLVMAAVCQANEDQLQDPFPFTNLPQELQSDIMVIHLINEIRNLPAKLSSLKSAAKKVRALTEMNKDLNKIINQSAFTLHIIKNFAERFDATDEQVAIMLGTRGALERINLQVDFLYFVSEYKQFSQKTFDDFIAKGVDVNWTDVYGNTPLIHAVSENKLTAVKALIKKGASVHPKYKKHKITKRNAYLFPGIPKGTVIQGGRNPLDIAVLSLAGKDRHTYRPGEKKLQTQQVLKMIKVLLDAGADPNSPALKIVEKQTDRPAVVKAIRAAQAAQQQQ